MNQNLKTVLIALLVTLVVSGFGWLVGSSKDAALTSAQQAAIQQTVANAVETLGNRPGALTGPEIPSPYLQWGNVNHWASASSPVATTTSGVFCAVQLPNGTTTVNNVSWRPDNLTGIGTTPVFDISTSTTVSGSSTPAFVVGASIGSLESWVQEASSTTASPSLVLTSQNTTGAANVFTVVSSAASPVFLTWRIATSSGNTGVIPSTMAGNCVYEGTQL